MQRNNRISPGMKENSETQRTPFSYLLEVMRINFANRLLAEVKKYFSECWVLLLQTSFEFFNHFILSHFLGQGAFVPSGLRSKITIGNLVESFLQTSPNFGSTQGNKEVYQSLLTNKEPVPRWMEWFENFLPGHGLWVPERPAAPCQVKTLPVWLWRVSGHKPQLGAPGRWKLPSLC